MHDDASDSCSCTVHSHAHDQMGSVLSKAASVIACRVDCIASTLRRQLTLQCHAVGRVTHMEAFCLEVAAVGSALPDGTANHAPITT